MAEDIILSEYPDGQFGSRKSLPPLPMQRKSTHTPMSEAMQGTMPSQADIARMEARAKEHRLKMGHID